MSGVTAQERAEKIVLMTRQDRYRKATVLKEAIATEIRAAEGLAYKIGLEEGNGLGFVYGSLDVIEKLREQKQDYSSGRAAGIEEAAQLAEKRDYCQNHISLGHGIRALIAKPEEEKA